MWSTVNGHHRTTGACLRERYRVRNGRAKISDCLGNAGSVAAIGWKRARVQTHMTPRFRNRQARTVDLNFIPGRNYSVPPLVGDFQLALLPLLVAAAVAGCCYCC